MVSRNEAYYLHEGDLVPIVIASHHVSPYALTHSSSVRCCLADVHPLLSSSSFLTSIVTPCLSPSFLSLHHVSIKVVQYLSGSRLACITCPLPFEHDFCDWQPHLRQIGSMLLYILPSDERINLCGTCSNAEHLDQSVWDQVVCALFS